MRIWRRSLIALAWIGAAAAVLFAALAVATAFPAGRAGLARLAAFAVAATTDIDLEIEGVDRLTPVAVDVRRIDVAMNGLRIAQVEGLHLRLLWTDLLRGHFRPAAIHLERLAIQALPEGGAADEEPGGFRIALPLLPAEAIHIDRLQLGAALLGEAIELRVAAMERAEGAEYVLDADVQRPDRPGDGLVLHARYRPDSETLTIQAGAAEAAGGPLARRLGAAPEAALHVQLDGAGPITAWRGRLAGGVDGIASIATDIGIDRGVGAVVGEAKIAPALLPELAPLLQDALAYRARLHWSAAEGLRIEGGELRLGEISLNLAGTVAPDLTDLQLQVSSDLRLAALAPFVATPMEGMAGILLHVTGAPTRPAIAADLALTEPRIGGIGVGRALLRLEVRPRGDGRFQAKIDGKLTDPVGAPPALAPILAGSFDLAALLDIAGDVSEVRVARLSLQGQALSVQGDGILRPSAGDSSGKIAVRAAVPEASGIGPVTAGQVVLEAEGSGDLAVGSFRAHATLQVEKLALADAALARVVGATPDFVATVARADGGKLQIEAARLRLAAGDVTASGGFDPAAGMVEADVTAGLPDLSRLSDLVGQALAGQADLAAHVSGPALDPAARGRIKLAGLVAASQRIERAEIGFELRQLVSEPQGHVALDARAAGTDVKLAGDLRLRDRHELELTRLQAAAPGLSAAGDLTLDIARTLARGRLSIDATDLAPAATVAGLPLAGRAQIALRLDAPSGKQQVAADLTGTGLRFDDLSLGRVEGQARLDDALGTPRGEVSLTGRDFVGGEVRLDQVQAAIQGNLARATFEVSLAGTAGGPVSARAGGAAGIDGSRLRVDLASFQARHGEIDIKLGGATELRGGAGEFRLADTEIFVAGTKLQLAGGIAGGQVDAYLRSGAFPLALLRTLRPDLPLSGTLAIEATAAGPAADPRLSLTTRSNDLRWQRGDTAVAFDLEAALNGGRLNGRATIGNLAEEPLRAIVALPLRVSLIPWRVDAPPEGRIEGRLDGNIDLARVLPPFLPDGDEVKGVAGLRIVVGGTLARPSANGSARLTGGRYENAMAEAAITDLVLDLTADGDTAKLELRGSDGDGGTVRLDSTVNLAAADQPIGGSLALRNFWVARRADAAVRMAGDVDIQGKVDAPRLAGKLTILQADLQLPEQLPPEVVKLDVVEINLPPGLRRPAIQSGPQNGDAGLRIGLDLTVSADRRVFVRGRGLQSEWSGNVQIRGDTQAPEIAGTLQALNGQLDFIGQRFVLSKGRLLFPGGPRINPDLDIVTEATRGEITAIVTVGGTLDAPLLSLGARPEMPPEEVISRVLFERGTARLTPLQAFQVAQAALSLARGGSGGAGVVDRLRRATGLDVLDFESGEGEGEAGAVSVGKYVSDNVLIRAEKGLDNAGPRAGIEVEVTPNISVESKVGANAATSVGVKIKKDY